MAAIKATVAFVMQIEDNNVRGHFLDVLPLLLEVRLSCFVESASATVNKFCLGISVHR